MSGKNHFVVWKGVRSGPFTKEELEQEFMEGKMGLVRTVLIDGASLPARDFVADIETKRREEELEEQLQMNVKQAEAARLEFERKEEKHRQQLEEAAKRPAGKTTPPPIPDINPWAPQLSEIASPPQVIAPKNAAQKNKPWWDGKGPVILASILCFLCLMTGLIFREVTGILGLILAFVLIYRRRFTSGGILTGCAILCYILGSLLSDLVYEYISKNYPN